MRTRERERLLLAALERELADAGASPKQIGERVTRGSLLAAGLAVVPREARDFIGRAATGTTLETIDVTALVLGAVLGASGRPLASVADAGPWRGFMARGKAHATVVSERPPGLAASPWGAS